ncbi:MAG: methyltransferase domain-containing protein [Candidatus Sericytochromatia bacterium]
MAEENKEVNKKEVDSEYKDSDNKYHILSPISYYLLSSKEKALNAFLSKYYLRTLPNMKIMEVGFGNGSDILNLIKYGAAPRNIYGTERSKDNYENFKYKVPDANLRKVDNFILPYPNNLFDIVIQSNVLSSINDEDSRKKLASEMFRLIKKGGKVFSYDKKSVVNNNIAINKAELKKLFPEATNIITKNITLNEGMAQFFADKSIVLCQILEDFSFLNSHYYTIIEK